MKPGCIKLKTIAALVAVCFLFTACGKGKPSTPPSSQVEAGKPVSEKPPAAGVKLDAAEPVVPAPWVDASQAAAIPVPQPVPLSIPATGGDGGPDQQAKLPFASQADNPPPVQADPIPPPASTPASVPFASAADVQALHEAMDRQAQASKDQAEHLQSALAALEQRLAQLESKPPSQPTVSAKLANRPKDPPKPKKPKAHVAFARRGMPQTLRHRSASGSPALLPFSVASVDTWDGEKQAMVRAGGQWVGLKVGDTRNGWRVESMDGQLVTVINPRGDIRHIEAGQGE